MSEQVWKYLPHVPQPKKTGMPKRRSEVTDKEVLNLTGGLFPLKVVEPNRNIGESSGPQEHWVRVPIVQRNPKIGPIYHWVRQGEEKKLYHGEKFNTENDVVTFSEAEFNSLQIGLPSLTFQVANKIFELLDRYSLNFVVVHDRLDRTDLSVEDIKDIYFKVSRSILMLRGDSSHPLASYQFDKKFECNRKYELEKYLMRSKVDTDREKNLIAQIRRLQILIKKEEREQINLKRALKLDQAPEEVFKLEESVNREEMRKNQRVYTRQQYLSRPPDLPGKVNERLNEVLQGMNIPEKIAASEENVELYDKLRQKVLLMFSMQRYVRKKENERRMLQDKKKRIQSAEEEEKSKGGSKMGEKPSKRVHTSK